MDFEKKQAKAKSANIEIPIAKMTNDQIEDEILDKGYPMPDNWYTMGPYNRAKHLSKIRDGELEPKDIPNKENFVTEIFKKIDSEDESK